MLTPEQIQFYEDNGYLLVEQIFTLVEINECVGETDAMFERGQVSGCRLEATWGEWQKNQIDEENRGKLQHSVSTICSTNRRCLTNAGTSGIDR